MSVLDAIKARWQDLPGRGGWIANGLSVFYAYEAVKHWLVLHLHQYKFVGILFSIDAAVFCLILCRSAIVFSHAIDTYVLFEKK